jgi:hypothetical protein
MLTPLPSGGVGGGPAMCSYVNYVPYVVKNYLKL